MPSPRPPDPSSALDEAAAQRVVQATTRSLLTARSPGDAVAALVEALVLLGAETAPVRDAGQDALPFDVALGVGEPLVPVAPPGGMARMHLERHLPQLLEDARAAVANLGTRGSLPEDTADPRAGLLHREAMDRVLARLCPGDGLCVCDLALDVDGAEDEVDGHPSADHVATAFARTLQQTVRAADHCGSLDGRAFVLILADAGEQGALSVLGRVRDAWAEARPLPVDLSAGVVEVADGESGRQALLRADAALLRAKERGHDRIETARGPIGVR